MKNSDSGRSFPGKCISPHPHLGKGGMRGCICFITGASGVYGAPEKYVPVILECGIRWIQYREKNKTRSEIFAEALKLRKITRMFEACLVINDHADIALAVDADGVHLGQEDLPLYEARRIMGNRIIGISTHSVQEAVEAERGGADYVGFGSIFPTLTKDVGPPKGTGGLSEVKRAVSLPVVALGGIKSDNISSVFESGCECVAISSGLLEGDIKENANKIRQAMGYRQ
jgi:thiamine-phosphate pyrophosphorylase